MTGGVGFFADAPIMKESAIYHETNLASAASNEPLYRNNSPASTFAFGIGDPHGPEGAIAIIPRIRSPDFLAVGICSNYS
jgi:hypothetical protein